MSEASLFDSNSGFFPKINKVIYFINETIIRFEHLISNTKKVKA
jgi:hypothetical protein